MGGSRADALRAVGERTNQPALRNALRVMTQAERLGANIAKILTDLAADARHQRLMLVEEMAAKLPVKMVFPMVFFMIPAIVTIIFGAVAANYLTGRNDRITRRPSSLRALRSLRCRRAACFVPRSSAAEDGPPAGKPPYVVLVGRLRALGRSASAFGATPLQLGIAAIVIFALVACWCSDTLCGIVPDAFTFVPLAALLLFAFAQRDWGMALSAVIVFVPFAIAALFSRGNGMGWGDAKLVALCGAALGAPLAFLALSAACAAAVVVHRFGGATRGPIAFAPYIAALAGAALPLGLVH